MLLILDAKKTTLKKKCAAHEAKMISDVVSEFF